jgi:diketogulonate reductase-like aldo/keto reductase
MKFETVHNMTLPKIGFGTWSLGGESSADPARDPASMSALRAALEIGYTHFDTAEFYAAGHCEELVGRAIRETKTKREKVFITSKVMPEHLKYNQVLEACERSLRRLKMDYLDLYLIHWPTRYMDLEETFRALNKLFRDGKVKHIGVSNFNLKQLKQSQGLSETPILTNQVPYSLPNDKYVENGVLDYCQKNEILVTAYSPIKFRSIRVNKTLHEITEAHSATPHQIALAWLVMQPRVITIPMSFNPQHIKENFDAAEIELSKEEMARLDKAWEK